MPIIRNTESGSTKPQFSVGVNIILVGSKKMSTASRIAHGARVFISRRLRRPLPGLMRASRRRFLDC